MILYLKKNPNLSIVIQGHTDDVGNNLDNQVLSESRAKTVKEYLISNDIVNILKSHGYGEQQPLVPNNSEEGRSINRRTSFRIIQ